MAFGRIDRRWTVSIWRSGRPGHLKRGAMGWTGTTRAMALGTVMAIGVGLVGTTPASAASVTFTVNTVADHVVDGCAPLASGDCTLREAITAANATVDADTITFAVPGAGVQTIRPTSDLPFITQPVVIDATSQPAYAGTPLIELDGSLDTGSGIGLWAFSPVTVQGFAINRFSNRAVLLDSGSSGSTIRANYLGTTADGTAQAGTFSFNALELRSSNNLVGGTTAADRNVIVGMLRVGPHGGVAATGNVVQGNYIGTNAAGDAGINNTAGIVVDRTTGTTIGGAAPGAGNLISGNIGHGIQIDLLATGTVVRGNAIGTNAAGTAALPNTSSGVQIWGPNTTIGGTEPGEGNVISGNGYGLRVQADHVRVEGNLIGVTTSGGALGNSAAGVLLITTAAHDNTIGGTAAGAGNTIAHNGTDGVTVITSTANAIEGNSIHSNGGLGIDLDDNGVTANDTGDTDTGANQLLNRPVLSSVSGGPTTQVGGELDAEASTAYRVEFFASSVCDPSGSGEGQTYLGFVDVTTDGSGHAAVSATVEAPSTPGHAMTAVAIAATTGDTSEFSACMTLSAPDSDGDGLTDDQEASLGYRPVRRGTDDDGLTDGDEVTAGHGSVGRGL